MKQAANSVQRVGRTAILPAHDLTQHTQASRQTVVQVSSC